MSALRHGAPLSHITGAGMSRAPAVALRRKSAEHSRSTSAASREMISSEAAADPIEGWEGRQSSFQQGGRDAPKKNQHPSLRSTNYEAWETCPPARPPPSKRSTFFISFPLVSKKGESASFRCLDRRHNPLPSNTLQPSIALNRRGASSVIPSRTGETKGHLLHAVDRQRDLVRILVPTQRDAQGLQVLHKRNPQGFQDAAGA